MSAEVFSFRDLYSEVLEYRRNSLYDDVLRPWAEGAQATLRECRRFAQPAAVDPRDEVVCSAAWNLYALSRVNDLLLLTFQQPADDKSGIAPLKLEEYERFFLGLGFEVGRPERFTPFRHEIVRVRQAADDEAPIAVVGFIWPALTFGELMFSRAGVEVTAGRNHCVKGIAEQSTLYFTYRRAGRPANDPSYGWGSNSQWRTRIRRDYETAGKWIYNFDGDQSLHEPPASLHSSAADLALHERIELLRHRCFITTTKPHDDLYPYSDRYEEPSLF